MANEIESLLAADCGSTMTSVFLFDKVEGRYRFVARGETPTTVGSPHANAMLAIHRAIGQIELVTGRTLLDAEGRLIVPERSQGGVDAFVATASAGMPLRLALVGLVQDMSLAQARLATRATYATIVEALSLDEGLTTDDVVRRLYQARPEVILIVGGTDGGAKGPVMNLAEAVALACVAMPEGETPIVIYAGNAALRAEIAEFLGAQADLRVVDNVLPTLDSRNLEAVQEELDGLYQECKIARLPGFGQLSAWSPFPIISTARAFARVVTYLAQQYHLNAIGLDLGSSTTVVASALDGSFTLRVRAELGVGFSLDNVLREIPMTDILRWLPVEMPPTTAQEILVNKLYSPATVPAIREELLLEQALGREILRRAMASARPLWRRGRSTPYPDLSPFWDLIIATGGPLSHAPRASQAALMLLDALEPIGVVSLALDRAKLAPTLGAVAAADPFIAAEILETDGLQNLGTVVAPVGLGRDGETVLRFKITYADGATLEVEVPYGSLEVIPLPVGQKATLELRPSPRFDIGWGRRGKGATTQVDGGELGVIVDARGRPLRLPDDPEARRGKIQKWLWDMGA